MKIGCCVGHLDQLPATRTVDLDYVEVSVAGLVMDGDAQGWERLRQSLEAGPPALAANVFLPSGVRLVGPDTDDDVLSYVQEAVRRLRRLGVKLLILGSGGPRRIPDGYPRDRGLGELAEFCRQTARIADAAGITLVLEPLRRAESNVWNTVSEAAAFIHDHRLDGVRLLADLYHMQEDGEPIAAVNRHADLLAHSHVAGRGRVPPHADGELGSFLRAVTQAREDITCSIECRWNDFAAELGPALGAVRAAGTSVR